MSDVKNGRCVNDNGIFWYENNILHREDNPAIERSTGVQEWFINGKRHRENGSAVIYPDVGEEWWFNGVLHRLDGPALIHGEFKLWLINGVEYTREEYCQFLHKKTLKDSLNQNLNPKKIISKMKI